MAKSARNPRGVFGERITPSRPDRSTPTPPVFGTRWERSTSRPGGWEGFDNSAEPAPVFTSDPSLTGDAIVGSTLTVSIGTASNATSYAGSLRHVSDDTEVDTFTADGTYVIQDTDFNEALYLHSVATGPGGNATAESAATGAADYAGLFVDLDTSVMASLYQDSAGTTPATAENDVIGRVTDLTGNGNHAIQTTTAKKMILKLALYNGHAAARADGADDSLQIPSITLPARFTVVAVVKTTTTKPLFIEHSANANTNNGFFVYGTTGAMLQVRRNNVSHSAAGPVQWLGASLALVIARYDGTHMVRKNGAAVSNGTITGTTQTAANATAALNIFSRDQASIFSDGDFCQLRFYSSVIADASLPTLEAFFKAKWGTP